MGNNTPIHVYLEAVYNSLSPEELFSRAKEYAWQTFFHHSTSVALIAYKLGKLVKSHAPSLAELAIESIESRLGIPYEDLLFLTGMAHDYVKLYGIENKTGRERASEFLGKIIDKILVHNSEGKERIISKIISTAAAVEGEYEPELENEYALYVAPIVSIADSLMSRKSIDEALIYLQTSVREVRDYGIRFGFIKVKVSSILQAKISEEVVELLHNKGWTPLAIYADGLILAGSRTSRTISVREISDIIREELEEALNPERKVRNIIARLQNLSLNRIYNLLFQTGGRELLSIDEERLRKREGEAIETLYHNLIVEYLGGKPVLELDKEITELKKIGKVKMLLDPRTLATGIRRGSSYFVEQLSVMIASKDILTRTITALNKRERFLILAYMVAFPSKEEGVIIDILKNALSVEIPKDIDRELTRIIAIAEVYKNLDDDDMIKKLIEVTYEKLGGSEDVDYYTSRFVTTKIKSDIVDTESLNSLDALAKSLEEGGNYCRVCGEPILKSSISFIQYAQAVGRGGGASEIWLHDDIPLADLEKIATDKRIRIRYICPICYYEAMQFRGRFSPPFFVVALHPVIAYDLWKYLESRLRHLSDIYYYVQGEPREVAKIYERILFEKNLKVTPDILFSLTEREGEPAGRGLILFDCLTAKVLLPLGKDMSLKRTDVAFALALAPFVMSLSGGGQVGLVSNLAEIYNLGVEAAPLTIPHPSNLVFSIVRAYEEVERYAKRQKRQMMLDEYFVYNQSYITLLEALYIYGLKVFSWYGGWKRKNPRRGIDEYALELHVFMTSVPYLPLALDAPPPERLDPRKRDEALPYYSLISLKSQEVGSRMSQIPKVLKKEEPPSLSKLLYTYAVSLSELNKSLSKYKVQRPLREGIEILLQYASVLGDDKEAKNLAIDKFLDLVASSASVDLERKVNYRKKFFNVFDGIGDLILRLRRELPPSKMRKLVEVILDSAYAKYRHAQVEEK